MQIDIKEASLSEAAQFLAGIPEFASTPYRLEKWERRLQDKPNLILMAYIAGEAVGCKAGYALDAKCFYSWMGGVMPRWRKQGVADKLAQHQEAWARNQGYTHVRFKTRNSCRAMLLFALRRDFNIISVEPKENIAEHRIWLEKEISSE